MRIATTIVLALAALRPSMAEDIVVIGRLVENAPMEYVPDECPENNICLRSWWKTVVSVQETVHGSRLSGRIAAAVMQHTSLNSRFKKAVRLFVLRPIEDPAQRVKLRVDYYLEEMSEAREMFCLGQDPKRFGLDIAETYVSGAGDDKTYCFELSKH